MRSTPRLRVFSFFVALLVLAMIPLASPARAQSAATGDTRGENATAGDSGDEDAAADAGRLDPELAATISFRSVGPLRGGRSTAVTGIAGDGRRFYMGTTGGGVWTTADAGLTWINITDGQMEVASIGAIDVADSDPNVIYVGTGSACIRGNASTGNGVYRSTDAGDSWSHVGLPDSGSIARVVVHPRDPDLVYVAVFGHPFGPNEERGVYRSEDGGSTWERILHVSAEVGAIDLSMDPSNPRILYAAMWRFERKPWTFVDASEDGGIFKSTDGGDSWDKLAGGLPTGLTGRIGISVSPADPERVYALVSAADPEGGLYRSDDAGNSWQRINRDRNLRQRHWYYSHVEADPVDPDTVYVMNVGIWRSIDGGRTVERLRPNHGDTHALWIDPADPTVMILGDDGGAEVSLSGGASWSSVRNQPTAEIYRVSVDHQFPYRVYGAQQDNSTLSLRSDGRGADQDWYSVGGCESGHIAVDPRDASIVYAGCYIGEISRYDHATGERRPISVYPVLVDGVAPRDLEHRFQWNAPILISRHDPGLLYHTSNTVNRTRDEGRTWEVISPDLTRNDPEKQDFPGGPLQQDHTSVEVYGTVFALAESPHDPAELWAGSDDGMIWVTRDDGVSWDDVTPPELPVDGTVNTIDVSEHRPGKVTVAVHRYRMDDWAPYVFQTTDGGASWRRLVDGGNGIPSHHPVRTVREDPDREGLLYAGTEFGLFVSFDDGAAWESLQRDLPVTPVTELVVHRQDLVVATQGRGIWILDDLTPLHQVDCERGEAPRCEVDGVRLYAPRPAIRAAGRGGRGATVRYRLPEGAAGTLEVVDAAGEIVNSWSVTAETEDDATRDSSDDDELTADGTLQSMQWNLRYPEPERPEGAMVYLGFGGGPAALPGAYTLRLTSGASVVEQPLEILGDPRRPDITAADLEAGLELAERTRDLLERAYAAITTLRDVRSQATAAAARAREAGLEGAADFEEAATTLADTLTALEEQLIQTRAESNQDPINFPPRLDNLIGYLYRYVNSSYGRPGRPAERQYEELESELTDIEAQLAATLESVADLNTIARTIGLTGVLLRSSE